MEAGEGRMTHKLTLEEELDTLRRSPVAQGLLDLLRDHPPERTEQLMTELTALSDEEGRDYGDTD